MSNFLSLVAFLVWVCASVHADNTSNRPAFSQPTNPQHLFTQSTNPSPTLPTLPTIPSQQSSHQSSPSTTVSWTSDVPDVHTDHQLATTTVSSDSLNGENVPSSERPCNTNSSTSNGIVGNLRDFLSSVVPSPVKVLFNSTLHATQQTTDRLRNRYSNFTQFLKQYRRNYSQQELQRRFKLFVQRLNVIEQSISDFAKGKSPFALGINKFIDWDESELKSLTSLKLPPPDQLDSTVEDQDDESVSEAKVGLKGSDEPSRKTASGDSWLSYFSNMIPTIPTGQDQLSGESKDWRTSGCMGPILDQGSCGACYAFAALGVVDAMKCIYGGASPTPGLSVQELVDCSKSYGLNNGCNGGWPTDVFNYLRDKRVVATNSCYPYRSRSGFCRRRSVLGQSSCQAPAAVKSSAQTGSYVSLSGERAMKRHLANVGPVVGIMEAPREFYFYKRGVYESSSCSRRATDVNHGLIIAGFGEENGKKFWLIKNSWDSSWGDNGYAKLRRGVNECSIEKRAYGVPAN